MKEGFINIDWVGSLNDGKSIGCFTFFGGNFGYLEKQKMECSGKIYYGS